MTFNTAYPAYVVFCHFMPKWVAQHVIFSNTQNLSNAGAPCMYIEKSVFREKEDLKKTYLKVVHYSSIICTGRSISRAKLIIPRIWVKIVSHAQIMAHFMGNSLRIFYES